MIRASEASNYQVPDERTGVTHLLKSTQGPHSMLQSTKVTVENDTNKRENFEEAADFLCRFAPKKRDNPGGLYKISSTNTDLKGELRNLKYMEVDVRFYTPDEWKRLTDDQRKMCILTCQLRNKGDSGRGGKRKFDGSQDKKSTNKWRKKIEKQGMIISALKVEISETKPNEDGSGTTKKKVKSNEAEKTIKFNEAVTQRKNSYQE